MSGIDLIPASYRRRAALRRSGKRVIVAGAVLFGISSLCLLALLGSIHNEEAAIRAYQSQADRSASLQENIRHLSEKKIKLEQALSVLFTARGAHEIPNALQALDTALNDGVWLRSLHIERNRDKMNAPSPTSGSDVAAATHMTLVQYGSERWQFRRTLQINGMATSYNAVADFIQALASQPGIAEVRLLNSGVASGEQETTFSFSASAMLIPAERLMP